MRNTGPKMAVATAVLSLVAVACSGGDDSSDSQDESERRVAIAMGDFFFEPATLDVTSGETVRFVVTNEGVVEHEFRVTNEALIAEHLEEEHEDEGHDEDGSEEEFFIVLAPGETGEIEITFPAGTNAFTEIACLLPGHYEAGMKGLVNYQA